MLIRFRVYVQDAKNSEGQLVYDGQSRDLALYFLGMHMVEIHTRGMEDIRVVLTATHINTFLGFQYESMPESVLSSWSLKEGLICGEDNKTLDISVGP